MTYANELVLSAVWAGDFDKVHRSAKRVLRDNATAEDVTMQVFVELGEALESSQVNEPRKLLYTILDRRLKDAIRTAVSRPASLPLQEAALGTEEWPVGDSFLSLALATFPGDFDTAVRDLPEPERQAFILTELRGLTTREAGDVLGVDHTTVVRRAAAARTTVQKELAT